MNGDDLTGWQVVKSESVLMPTGKNVRFDEMDPTFMDNLNQLAQEYYTRTGQPLKINDAWRSRSTQAQAYKTKPNLAAPPGHSLHETGKASDVDEEQANWLANTKDENGQDLLSKYGFTRPMMTKAPGKKYEPWHIEMMPFEKANQIAATVPQIVKVDEAGWNKVKALTVDQEIFDKLPGGRQSQSQQVPTELQPQLQQPLATPEFKPPPGYPTISAETKPGRPFSGMQPQAPSFGTMAGAASVETLPAKIKHYAREQFPNEPIEQSVKRYFTKNGGLVFMDDDGQVKPVIPLGIGSTAKKFAADIVGNPLKIAGGIPGLIADSPALAGLGAAIGGTAQRGINAAFGVEPFGSPLDAAKEAAVDFAVTGIGTALPGQTVKGVNTVRGRKLPGTPANVLISDIEKVRGIDQETLGAINRELRAVSPVGSKSTAGELAVSGAREVEESLKQARIAATQPLYEAAYAAGTKVDTKLVIKRITDMKKVYGENTDQYKALAEVQKQLSETDPKTFKQVPITDLRKLQSAKEALDDMLMDKGTTAIPNAIKRDVNSLKNQLLGLMDKASPEFNEARREYRVWSKPIADFRYGNPEVKFLDQKSSLRTLMAKISDLGEGEASIKAPGIIFSEPPEVIAKARQYFQARYPDAWNATVRSRLEEKLGNIGDATKEGQLGYTFKKRVFDTPNEKAKLQAAMSSDQFNRISKFMDVLDETRKIVFKPDTPSTSKIYAALNLSSTMRGTIRVFDYLNPIAAIGRKLDKARVDKFHAALSDALLDPNNMAVLTKINRLSEPVKRTAEVAGFLSGIIDKTEGSEWWEKSMRPIAPQMQEGQNAQK